MTVILTRGHWGSEIQSPPRLAGSKSVALRHPPHSSLAQTASELPVLSPGLQDSAVMSPSSPATCNITTL